MGMEPTGRRTTTNMAMRHGLQAGDGTAATNAGTTQAKAAARQRQASEAPEALEAPEASEVPEDLQVEVSVSRAMVSFVLYFDGYFPYRSSAGAACRAEHSCESNGGCTTTWKIGRRRGSGQYI